jgi:hypothetical protein
MRTLTLVFFIGILISLSSCRTDFETVASTGDLGFSKDTVYLDTIFANIGSSTYNLKVYNKSNKDITIPSIKFEKELSSKFRMTIDGMQGNQGKTFDNVTLLAKDSLYIFIETTVITSNDGPKEFLYTDKIMFDSGANLQKVELVTLVQDAIFIKPNRPLETGIKEKIAVSGFYDEKNIPSIGHTLVGSELIWTKDKPYVIYGYAVVPNSRELVIDSGARVYFHSDASLIVDNMATIKINGSKNDVDSTTGKIIDRKEVTFEGDRLEPEFEDLPGQWGALMLFSGSSENQINYLNLKNATLGLWMQRNDETVNVMPRLKIDNSQIYNCSNYGILAKNSTVSGTNLVINNCGEASLACTYGGIYNFTHCTFNNNWNSTSQVAVLVNNYILGANPGALSLVANFKNCIIYGSNNVELFLDKDETATFNTSFENCLIKFNDIDTGIEKDNLYNFIRNEVSGNIKNKDPKFFKQNQNKLNIDETSAAYQKGNKDYRIETDILGATRTATPDIGAYQSAPFTK